MKIREYSYTRQEQLDEFDNWVTPSLGDLKDYPEVSDIVGQIAFGYECLSGFTDGFKDSTTCTGRYIARCIYNTDFLNDEDFSKRIVSVINAILLATGKTDNNLKCQYPIKLNKEYNIKSIKQGDSEKKIPRTIEIETYVKLLVFCRSNPEVYVKLLDSYFSLLLSDEQYSSMLQVMGSSYISAKDRGVSNSFLMPLAIFQSRGSLTAKGGHTPEAILRDYMLEWGLEGDWDYNLVDVDVYSLLNTAKPKDSKTRAFDFIIPYKSRMGDKLFIQSQYYAGDSGSVSHKVVDQTRASRDETSQKFNKEGERTARYVEFLDGAGYYSSLNGDLKKMLAYQDTTDFFQIRTAPLKLRRNLQAIGFLTALEIEHAILKGYHSKSDIKRYLLEDGYSSEEIERCWQQAVNGGIVEEVGGCYSITAERRDVIVKYALLDCIAIYGDKIDFPLNATGYYVVPGFGSFWGLNQTDLILILKREFPSVNTDAGFIIPLLQELLNDKLVRLF